MKEEDAKKKTCPANLIIMTSVQLALAGNEKSINDAKTISYCAGSGCMMWESWEYEKLDPTLSDGTHYVNVGEGDCGLKTKEACHEI